MDTTIRKRPRSRHCICNCKCDLTLFSFPHKDFDLHHIWLKNLGMTPESVSHKSVMSRYCCINHFEEHSFYPNIIKLIKGAMPTIIDCSLNKTFRSNPKLKRSLTTTERESVIEHSKFYPNPTELSKIFNCGRTQIRNILREANSTPETTIDFYQKADFLKGLGMIVKEWVVRTQAKNYVVTHNTIKVVASKVALLLDIPQFRPHLRWLNRVITKYKITNVVEDVPRTVEQIDQLIDVTAIEVVISNIKYYLPDCVKNKIDSLGSDFRASLSNKNHLHSTNNSLLYHNSNSYEMIDGIPHPINNSESMDVYTISDSDDDDENNDYGLTSEDDNVNDLSVIADISEVDALDIEIKEEKFVDLNNTNFINTNAGDDDDEIVNKPKRFKRNIEDNLQDNIYLGDIQNNADDKVAEINNSESFNQNQHSQHIPKIKAKPKTIMSALEAIEHLRPLEEYALVTSNFRAINFINNLEELFKDELKKQPPLKKEL